MGDCDWTADQCLSMIAGTKKQIAELEQARIPELKRLLNAACKREGHTWDFEFGKDTDMGGYRTEYDCNGDADRVRVSNYRRIRTCVKCREMEGVSSEMMAQEIKRLRKEGE